MSSDDVALPAVSPPQPGEPELPPPPATPDEIRQAQLRVFESLPPEVQRNPEIRARFGLGDAVELVARPIARALGIKDCGGCAKRKARLNRVRLW
jgi:hypothetical protein